jgi:hypothetical protein
MVASIAFGCRKNGTKEGTWAGAFVYFEQGSTRVMAVFEHGKDYIHYPKCVSEGLNAYETCIEDQGWIPMTLGDISETSGVSVDSNTAIYADVTRANLIAD